MKKELQELVSIVVPVYNVEAYLSACLDSLLQQTYQKIEILLIDDGSTDESRQICDAYAEKDARIQVFHQENAGVSAARNFGIENAKGTYLLFVDSDDQVHSQLVEIYMNFTGSGQVLFCDTASCVEELDKTYDDKEHIPLERTSCEHFVQLFGRYYMNPPFNKLYITKVLNEHQIRFPQGNSLGEDLLFNLEYFRYVPKDYHIIRIPLYYYREERDGSLSTSYRRDLFEIQQESFSALKRFLQDMNLWNAVNKKGYYEIYWDRLYLTVKICKKYGQLHPEEPRWKEILKDAIWKEVWKSCKETGAVNWKRRIKAVELAVYRWSR